MSKESEESQTVADGNYNDVLSLGKSNAVAYDFTAASGYHSAAMDPDEYRQLVFFCLGRCPDVQIQTVFLIL